MKLRRVLGWGAVGSLSAFAVIWRLSSFHSRGQCTVQGAGNADANGFYVGLDGGSAYAKPSGAPRLASGRLPDVFQSWAALPRHLTWSPWAIQYDGDAGWVLSGGAGSGSYYAPDFFKGSSRQPPANLWKERSGVPPAPTLTNIRPLMPKEPSAAYKRLSESVRMCYERPGTTLVIALNLAVAYYLWAQRIPVEQVSFSLQSVVYDKEYHRVITASLAHLDLLHLCFNLLSLYNLGALENQVLGSMAYLTLSATLLLTTMLSNLLAYALLTFLGRQGERPRHQQSVGYSCIIFALIVAASVLSSKYCPMPGLPDLCFKTYFLPLGGAQLPINLAPFFLLILTQLLMPRASFIGHLSGILLGYPLAWRMLDPLSSPPLLALLSLALILANEPGLVIKRCQPSLPHDSPAQASPPQPPPLLPLLSLLTLLLTVTLACIPYMAVSLWLPPLCLVLLSFHALVSHRPPSPRLLSLLLSCGVLPLLASDLLTLACTLARGPLYLQTNLLPSAQALQLCLVLLCLRIVLVGLLGLVQVRCLQSCRQGYSALTALGIELQHPDTQAGYAPGLLPLASPVPFAGHGRTLGTSPERQMGPRVGERTPSPSKEKPRVIMGEQRPGSRQGGNGRREEGANTLPRPSIAL